jgi:hypothetical protein
LRHTLFRCVTSVISQKLGYTDKATRQIKVPTTEAIVTSYKNDGLATSELQTSNGITEFASLLLDYFQHRAMLLNTIVEPQLMNVTRAATLFEQLRRQYNPPGYLLPMNKQKGDKKTHAYFTSIINMLIHAHSQGYTVNYDPRLLTSFTRAGLPVRTLSRRVDGAFPDTINPLAIWEIKEYYYTTTFGSRVADGVYETLLDGLELKEAELSLGIPVGHYLMIDDHFTWWQCGRSYLCRMIDMLHMGLVSEVLFGAEVVDRIPSLVAEWIDTAQANGISLKRQVH